ncbi:MAG: strain DSM, partial [Planctomycetes bacterium]|nr:strain DSM [Planctomycetota bacterium]
ILTILTILIVAAALDGSEYILATPVATNVVLLVSFGVTLRPGSMPMIERFARLQEKELDGEKRAWCRMWTWIWCAFFVANGATAALLALYAEMRWWALYNGLLCYALIGSLFAIEWLLRRVRFPDVRRRKAEDETA